MTDEENCNTSANRSLLEYIRNRYGTPCAAWAFKAANNWY